MKRRRSLDATLAAQPTSDDVWLFAYGSLIWNPAFATTSSGSLS